MCLLWLWSDVSADSKYIRIGMSSKISVAEKQLKYLPSGIAQVVH